MKIDLANIKPTLDSLSDKANPGEHGFRAVFRGSRVLLLAMKLTHPERADIINTLLENRDFDLQLEPIDSSNLNIITLRPEAEKLNDKLSNKHPSNNKPSLPDEWKQFYSLPTKGIKHANKKDIDLSIQVKSINSCMNTDQKCDFSGEILYLNDQYKKDFEETYLQKNLIIFYDIDNVDYKNSILEQTKMAFRLRKCLKTEITTFGSLLAPDTAVHVKNLLENPALTSVKSLIFNQMNSHYKMDIGETERALSELVQKSIDHHLNTLNHEILQINTLIMCMISDIKHDETLQQKLDKTRLNMMASPSEISMLTLGMQLEILEHFRRKLDSIYIESQNILNAASAQIQDAAHLESQSSESELSNMDAQEKVSKSKHKKKKKKTIENGPATPEISTGEMTVILEKEKSEYPNKIPLEARFKALLIKHKAVIKMPVPHLSIPSTTSIESSHKFYNFMLLKTFMATSVTSAPHADLFYELNDFYKDAVSELQSEQRAKSATSDLSETQVSAILTRLDSLRQLLNHQHIMIEPLNAIFILAHFGSLHVKDSKITKKAIDCLRTYIETKDRNIEVLMLSYYKILKEPAHNSMIECVKLIYDAAFNEFRNLLNSGKSGIKNLKSIEILIELTTSATLFIQYKSFTDIVELDFIKSLGKALIEQTSGRDGVFELFTSYFINQTIASLSMGDGKPSSDHFEQMISQAGLMIVSHIYPTHAFAQNPGLITHIISCFEADIIKLKSLYSILKLAVPIITADPQNPFRFISSETSKLVDAVNVFASMRGGVSAEEVKLIIKMAQTEVQRMRDQFQSLSKKKILQSFEMTLVSLKILSEHSGYLFDGDGSFEQKFIDLLRSSTEFMDLSQALCNYKITMPRSPSNKKLLLDREDYLQVLTKKSGGVVQQPTAPSDPLTADFSIVSHVYNSGSSESSSSRTVPTPSLNRSAMPSPQ